MIIVTIIYLLLILFSIRVKSSPFNNELYLEGYKPENTNAVKGLLAFGILLSHIPKFANNELPFTSVTTIGSIGVGIFLFFSGYVLSSGLLNSVCWSNGFILKKSLRIGVPFLFLFFSSFVFNVITNNTKEFFYSFINGDPYSNTWYVFTILLFYIFFYVSFKRCDHNNKKSVLIRISLVFFLVLLYIVITAFILRWSDWWYRTALCFVIGVLFGFFMDKIEIFIKKHYFLILCFCLLFAFCSYFLPAINNRVSIIPNNYIWLVNDALTGLSFTFLMMVIIYKVSFENPICSFLGKYSYEIYLWHGFVMIILSRFFEKHLNNLLLQEIYSMLVLLTTIILAVVFNKLSRIVIKK